MNHSVCKRILVTGASGFIGSRLVPELLRRNHNVRCMDRHASGTMGSVEYVQADLLRPETLPAAFDSVYAAYYLVHSMGSGGNFAELDRMAASNFVSAAEKAGVKRVIYLGGLGGVGDKLSHHLASRLEVARILQSGNFSTTFLRAAVIIGAGGSSYEMIKALVERLPLMITPRWVNTRSQPIAVDNVIDYLAGVLEDSRTDNSTFDIGGPEILTYREMMERFAFVEGKKLLIIPVPVLTPRLSSYWVGLVTPVRASLAIALIEGLVNEVICNENRIRDLIPLELISYNDAVKIALTGKGIRTQERIQ